MKFVFIMIDFVNKMFYLNQCVTGILMYAQNVIIREILKLIPCIWYIGRKNFVDYKFELFLLSKP